MYSYKASSIGVRRSHIFHLSLSNRDTDIPPGKFYNLIMAWHTGHFLFSEDEGMKGWIMEREARKIYPKKKNVYHICVCRYVVFLIVYRMIYAKA